MTEEEQEKLYELLFKDTKNKLEATIEKQQKEIEELKNADFTLVYMNGFYDGEKKWKDKINDKIKEYQNKLFQDVEENKVVEYENIIQVLEELLEEK